MELPRTTEAMVLVSHGEPLARLELEIPALQAGQVLVEIAFSGICHTQLGEIRGKRGPDAYMPHCLGHEAGATVIALGEGVDKVSLGQRVVVSWIKSSGANVGVTVYQRADGGGKINAGAVTTFMRHAVVSENRLVPIPDDFPLDVAALLGCALPTGGGAVMRTGRAVSSESVAIFGVGGVGLSALLMAVHLKCDPIIAVDVLDEKLTSARGLGATHTINGKSGDAVARLLEMTDGKGVDVAIEAAGVPQAMEWAYAATRNGGGRTVLAGNLAHGSRIEIDPFPILMGRELLGAGLQNARPDEDVPRFVEAYRAGEMKLDELISHRWPLAELDAAMDLLEQGQVRRGLIDMSAG